MNDVYVVRDIDYIIAVCTTQERADEIRHNYIDAREIEERFYSQIFISKYTLV